MPRALVDRGIMSERALEEELSRRSGAPFRQVQADSALVARLPRGLCRMLAAVPLGTDAAGVVELAVVDPLDGHVASEFGFHLGANVRVRRATMVAVAAEAVFVMLRVRACACVFACVRAHVCVCVCMCLCVCVRARA